MVLHSIFSSDYSEQRWVDQITKNFEKEVAINVSDVPVCVFTVPKSISTFKPEAYIPQVIALGPYHHFTPELYHMERFKLAAVKTILTPNLIRDFRGLVIDKLIEIEPIIRACYHKYLDMNHDTLALIVAIDGMFLLHLLQDYADVSFSLRKRVLQSSVLYGDVMVVENQIPVILLKEIREILRLSFPHSENDLELFAMLKGFCQVHSPLKLTHSNSHSWHDVSHLHLLDLMYHLIVSHRETEPPDRTTMNSKVKKEGNHVEIKKKELIFNVGEIVDVGLSFGIGKKVLRPVQVIRNMPWDKITTLLGLKTGHTYHDDEITPLAEEIDVPSVSDLYNYGRVTLSHTVGGIRDIKFIASDAILYLPIITLNSNSEVILRNLVAYELATSDSTLELTQYVDMMCGIIDTAADVKLLKEKQIIKGDLGNEEIAKLFNGINKTSGSEGHDVIQKLNEYYNKRPVVKAYRVVKKRVIDSWKALTVISTAVLIFLLLVHSFCEIYGCPHFFGSSS